MYQALYRKYRPVDFDSVVGQDSIVKTLKNSIVNNNFSHAYIFFGPRGTGKTTISKIFARNINCLKPKDGIACGKCESCKVSFSKDCVDIIEIDAASNNGVDEIRELKNRISLVPSVLKYKVYIIDEVHMLSIGAFNALLKTLEEPPEHAVFILATTDFQKVPDTIISRCQTFSFKKISSDVIKNRLYYVCKTENIAIDENVLDNIAILSDGGLRDALGLLDKLVSYSNGKITMNDFIEVNGIISNDQISSFINSIMLSDISSVLSDISFFDSSGKNLIQIINQLINYSRNLLVEYYLHNKKLDYSIDLLQSFINLLNEKMFDLKRSSNTKIFFEILILKFISDNNLNSNNSISVDNKINNVVVEKNISKENDKLVNVNELSKNNENNSIIDNNSIDNETLSKNVVVNSNKILNLGDIIKVRVNNTLALASKEELKHELELFDRLRDYSFDQNFGYIVCALLDCSVRVVSHDNIVLSCEYDSNVEQNLQILDKMIDVYNNITNSNKKIAIISDSDWEKEKKRYIENIKNNVKYEVLQEPEVIFEESNNNDIITSSAVDLFGDIVEIN